MEKWSNIVVHDDVDVKLVQSVGGDDAIVQAMLVSTQGADSLESTATKGRINFLMANRHGTPFEHNSMTFYIAAPIFVFREFHRHRVGWSYNEMSGRYKELKPNFYVPGPDRPLVQVGKPGHYEFVPGTVTQYANAELSIMHAYAYAYERYRQMLEWGIAKEVARMVLPVGIFSEMYATCNARSLMHFLSLRTKDENSKFPSYPQAEIEYVAQKMEAEFAQLFPLTYATFVENGRVAP